MIYLLEPPLALRWWSFFVYVHSFSTTTAQTLSQLMAVTVLARLVVFDRVAGGDNPCNPLAEAMLSLTTLLACSTTPTFPLDYYTGEQVNLLQYTDASRSDTNVCCAPSAANCQLKVESTGSDAYTQGSQGRVLTNAGGHGTQLQWFDPINKLMGLAPGSTTNSSHKWVCALYCPQSGKYVPDLDIGAGGEKVSDLGRQNVTQAGAPGDASKVCETYQWTQHLFHILPIAQLTMWVDDKNASSPAPFLKELEIYDPTHPLKKDVLIRGNTSYLGFTPGDHCASVSSILRPILAAHLACSPS